MKCGLSWCESPQKYDGLCQPHAYLFDWWGCERSGYSIYMESGKKAGRAAFKRFLLRVGQEGCLEILAQMATNDHTPKGVAKQVKIAAKKYGALIPEAG